MVPIVAVEGEEYCAAVGKEKFLSLSENTISPLEMSEKEIPIKYVA
jgi:hypothetical protein